MQSKFIKENFIINWQRVFLDAFKRWWVILIAFIVGAVGGYSVSTFILTPTYKCEIYYLLSFNSTGSGVADMYSQYNLASKMLQSCTEVAQLNGLSKYLEEHGVNEGKEKGSAGYLGAGYIGSKISFVKSTKGGMLIIATVAAEDKTECERISTTLQNEFCNYMHVVFDNTLPDGTYLVNFTIANNPKVPNYPTAKLSTKVLTVLGAMIGTIICYIILCFVELGNKRIKSEIDLQNRYNAPVLGLIFDFNESDANRGYSYKYEYKS